MAQEDYSIANQSRTSFRADLNSHLQAIVTNNSGATAPTTMFPYMWWADTTTGLLKQRNAANSAWITIGTLASANLGLAALSGAAFTGTVSSTAGDINPMAAVALTDANATLTAAQLTGSRIFTITPTVARILTTDTAANIIAALGGYDASFPKNIDFTIINTAAFDVTLAAGVGVTLTGKMVVNNGSGHFRIRIDSASAVTIYTHSAISAATTAPNSAVIVHSGNGHGSTNTAIRRYTTTALSVGADITYADSATLGASFTINTTGLYAVFVSDNRAGGVHWSGASLNSPALTTIIQNRPPPERICFMYGAGADWPTSSSNVIRAVAGDVIRPHTDGTPNYTTDQASFSVRRVA